MADLNKKTSKTHQGSKAGYEPGPLWKVKADVTSVSWDKTHRAGKTE